MDQQMQDQIDDLRAAQSARVALIIRHSESVQDGPQNRRTLTPDGIRLAQRASRFYRRFVGGVITVGMPEYWSSQWPRAIVTLWELFHPAQMGQTALLNLRATCKDIRDGAWLKEQRDAGKTDPEVIRMVFADPDLRAGQNFDAGRDQYLEFAAGKFDGCSDSRFLVAVCHEIHISHAAHGLIPEDQIGLNECEGVLFFIGTDGKPFAAKKIVPELDEIGVQ